ncbi:hypothetical protein HY251_03105 [bacterium]|nr:hypothetical protein [bacterium]
MDERVAVACEACGKAFLTSRRAARCTHCGGKLAERKQGGTTSASARARTMAGGTGRAARGGSATALADTPGSRPRDLARFAEREARSENYPRETSKPRLAKGASSREEELVSLAERAARTETRRENARGTGTELLTERMPREPGAPRARSTPARPISRPAPERVSAGNGFPARVSPGFLESRSPGAAPSSLWERSRADVIALALKTRDVLQGGIVPAFLSVIVLTPLACLAVALVSATIGRIFGLLFVPVLFVICLLAVAVVGGGPLSAFMAVASGRKATFREAIEQAFVRSPRLACVIFILALLQLVVAAPFGLLGWKLGLPEVGVAMGAIAAFMVSARVGVLCLPLGVVDDGSFQSMFDSVLTLGRGRLALLVVAAGVPKLLVLIARPSMIGMAVLQQSVGMEGAIGFAVVVGVVAQVIAFFLDLALCASALAVAGSPCDASRAT